MRRHGWLILALLALWGASAARATSVAAVAIAPANPTAGSWVTVTANVTIDAWQGGSYAIAFSANTTPDSGDTWLSLSMGGSCPGNGYAAGTAGAAPTLFPVSRSFYLPATVTFPGTWYVIVIAASNSWIGSCTGSANAPQSFTMAYYSPTFTVTPTPPNTPTVSPTGVQNVAHTTFGPSNAVAFIVVSPTQTNNYTPSATPTRSPTPSPSPSPSSSPTASPTASPTLTLTPSPSRTPTSTSTSTPTPTPSATQTRTFSPTPTPSATLSSTPTATSSQTFSFTPTLTATPTPSLTSTQTRTFSPTATPSATPTPSPTATQSDTFTPTKSCTNTPTATPTATQTWTFSSTATPSATPTPSPTATQSDTFTPTKSCTNTPTATPTATQTWTFSSTATSSVTPTPTPTATQSDTFTPTKSSTFTPTVSPSATETATFSATPSLTATLTPTPSPTVSASPSPSGTLTQSPTQSRTMTGSPTDTPTRTVSPTSTITLTRTPSPTKTQTFTSSPTPVPVPYQMRISAYNEAGELVKLIFNGQAQIMPASLVLSSSSASAAGGGLGILIPGFLSQNGLQAQGGLTWDLSNNGAQPVSGGIYYIKAEFTDAFGKTSSMSEPVQVINTNTDNTLTIFNSAGEEVYHRTLSAAYPAGIIDLGIEAKDSQYAPVYDSDGALQGPPLNLKGVDSRGAIVPLSWDGKNDQGLPVSGGTYSIQVAYQIPGGQKTVVTRSVTIIKTGDNISLAGSTLGPNPLMGEAAEVVVKYPPSLNHSGLARVYNLAGELVATGMDDHGSGRIIIKVGHLAGGIYVVKVEKLYGEALKAQIFIKMAVAR